MTGLLLHSNGKFLQVLEGPQEKVTALYEKIAKDQRHHRVRTVWKAKIEKREFWAWPMAFFIFDPAQYRDTPGFAEFFNKPYCSDFALCTPGESSQLLRQFHRAFAPATVARYTVGQAGTSEGCGASYWPGAGLAGDQTRVDAMRHWSLSFVSR